MNNDNLEQQIQDSISRYIQSDDFQTYIKQLISKIVIDEFTATDITATNLSLTGTLEIGTEIIDHGPFSQLIQHHSQMIVDQMFEPYRNHLEEMLKDSHNVSN
jgi:hypothetical protein